MYVKRKNVNVIRLDNIELDPTHKSLLVNDEYEKLSKMECEILKLFLQNPGKVFSEEDILKKVWGKDVNITRPSIDVNIKRLKNKLGEYSSCLLNKAGYGYFFEF